MLDARDHLAELPYPGRGLMVGRTADGVAFELYWITGRSDASRSRRAVREGTAVDIRAPGQSGPTDPLRHYRAMCRVPGWAVLGNGEHVAPIAAALGEGSDLLAALRVHSFEPDALRTPRIVGAVAVSGTGAGPFAVGAARPSPDAGGEGSVEHVALVAADATPGAALAIHTYAGRPDRVEPDAEPRWMGTGPDLATEVRRLWQALAEDVRVLVIGRPAAHPEALVTVP